ncbi:MAG: acyl-CoA synthetase [Paracoccaceae bacterium]
MAQDASVTTLEDGRLRVAGVEDKRAIEATPLAERWPGSSVHGLLAEAARRAPKAPAISFQLQGKAKSRAETLDFATLLAEVNRTANLLRRLGVGPGDRVALVLPNANETVLALLGGMTAATVCPINPLLEPSRIAGILRECGAKAVVTLKPFVKTDVPQKLHAALEHAPGVETVLEVDLARYLGAPLSWIIGLMRPKCPRPHRARVLDFHEERAREADTLGFEPDGDPDRVVAMFHTGGTTGAPKVARHTQRGAVYNGMAPTTVLIGSSDVLICPLPLFHVLAAYPILMSVLAGRAHMVMPTPAGYRGDGVMDNFWALVERWGVTLMVMVPTAASALLQRPVTSDVSSLKFAICGSAPLPVGLFRRFEEATGVKILEGYGMTEATCLVSVNPPDGEAKVGSVGLPIPYTEVAILKGDGTRCETGVVGEICLDSPGAFAGYTDDVLNENLFAEATDGDGRRWLRTGDLGRLDEDGYLWITGRAKDVIIRGGHNIAPALIEEAMCRHDEVAFAGAIGQPDAHSGEVPAVYVELCAGATVDRDGLLEHAQATIEERAAIPKHVEIMGELPKTAVGKVFKPDLRKRAIARIYEQALREHGVKATVEVVDDRSQGMVAEVRPDGTSRDEAAVREALEPFARPWRLAGD